MFKNKKNFILIFTSFTLSLLISACSVSPINSGSGGSNRDNPPLPAPPAPTPAFDALKDAVLYPGEKSFDELEDKELLYTVIGKLETTDCFSGKGAGESVAKKGFIKYTQKTSGTYVKRSGKHYSSSVSNSTFVNVNNEAVECGDFVFSRRDGGSVKKSTVEEYASQMGITPSKPLSAHIYNDDTISSITRAVNDDDTVTLYVKLKKEEAHKLCRYQMKNFGGLEDYPVFLEDTAVTLVITKDFLPLTLSYASKYTVSVAVLGSLTCNETYKTAFSYNDVPLIPDESEFTSD